MPITGSALLPDGRTIQQITLNGCGLTVKIVTMGAAVQDIRKAGHQPSLVLGFEDIADYANNAACMGAIAGSVANRIGQGQFAIDGQIFELDKNWLGKHTLHGGAQGTQHQNWNIVEHDDVHVVLEHLQPDGHMGFPGNLTLRCTYTLLEDATLDVALSATTDQATYVNLASHCYFNLDGRPQIDQHELQIFADGILEYDDDAIPTGTILTQTAYQEPTGVADGLLDHNFCLAQTTGMQLAARVTTQGGCQMDVWTDQPGLQAYNAPEHSSAEQGLDGAMYGTYCGLALEPQNWPDAPNKPNFPSARLNPGETYRSHSKFCFS